MRYRKLHVRLRAEPLRALGIGYDKVKPSNYALEFYFLRHMRPSGKLLVMRFPKKSLEEQCDFLFSFMAIVSVELRSFLLQVSKLFQILLV